MRFLEMKTGQRHGTDFDLVCSQAPRILVQGVGQVEGLDQAEDEVQVQVEPGGLVTGLVDPVVRSQDQHPESIESRVGQGQAVLGLVHAEPARPARARGQVNVGIHDPLAGHPLRLEAPQVFHQVPHREVRRIAETVVPVLLPDGERIQVRRWQGPAPVSHGAHRRLHELVVLRRETADQDGGMGALLGGERKLHRPTELGPLMGPH